VLQILELECKRYYGRISYWLSKGDSMAAKQAFVIVALMMATIGLSIADIPNLAGDWTGSFKGIR
jgi:uncharacterized membrane protein YbaN (DUF454 family)